MTALCDDQGLDPDDARARQRVAYHHKKLGKIEWAEEELQTSGTMDLDEADGEKNLEKMLSNSGDCEMTDLMEEAVFAEMLSVPLSLNATSFDTALYGALIDFVEYFARINITRNQRLARQNQRLAHSPKAVRKPAELSTNGWDKVTVSLQERWMCIPKRVYHAFKES